MKEAGFFAEFRKFISKGNVLDMAVGVIIGSAFNAIVTSLVNDIINPVIGLLIGGADLENLSFTLRAATEVSEAVTLDIGSFANSVINFLIIAITLFVIVKAFNKMRDVRTKKEREEAEAKAKAEAEAKAKAEAEAAVQPPKKADDILLLEEIRDLLKAKN